MKKLKYKSFIIENNGKQQIESFPHAIGEQHALIYVKHYIERQLTENNLEYSFISLRYEAKNK